MRRVFLLFFVLFAVMVPVTLADTPETGVIQGTVTNPQGDELPGVTVTLIGERGEQTAITGPDGSFRFALLRPGGYTVRAQLEGFQGVEAPASVSAGAKVQVPLTMALSTEETITVTSEAPMVDKFNVTAGSTVTADVGAQAAGDNRTYYGVINMLPGVTSDAENGDIQGTRPQVNGTHFADQAVFIDGVDTTFGRFGGGRVLLPTSATSEVSLVAGGASAEYGRKIGSTTNVIVKSGTNTFHSDLVATYADADWYSDYDSHIELTQREEGPVSPDFLKRQPIEEEQTVEGFEFGLGGPLARDKAWFFVAWSDFDTGDFDQTLSQELVDVSVEVDSKVFKFNVQPTQSHQLAASFIDSFAARVYFHPPSFDVFTPTPHRVPGELFSLTWNYSISPDLFLETKLADQTSDENKFLAVPGQDLSNPNSTLEEVVAGAVDIKQQDPRFPPVPGAGLPHNGRNVPGNNYNVYITGFDNEWHNGWLLDNGFGLNEYPREQANVAFTHFVGADHELKYGSDWQEIRWDSNVRTTNLVFSGTQDFASMSPSGFTPGGCGIVFNAAFQPPEGGAGNCFFQDFNPPDLLAQGNLSTAVNQDISFYIRDRFTAGDHWTFNLGVRAEDVSNENDVGREVVENFQVAPRIAANYDVKGDGRQIISLNAGRYYAQLNMQFTTQWLQEQWNGYIGSDDYIWCSSADVLLHTVILPGVLTDAFGGGCNSVGYNFQIRHVRPGEMWQLVDQGIWDSDIDPYYKDEIILGYEWQFTQNWALDAKAIAWELGDMIGNTLQRDQNGSFFTLAANYDDYQDILRSINAEAARLGNDPIVPDNVIAGFREGETSYEALQLQVNRRFANGWAWYNNVTWADNSTSGNGAWWNNTNSTYGRDLGTLLTQAHIDQVCDPAAQAVRTVPLADCAQRLMPHIGEPISTINRFGKMGVASGSSNEGGALAGRQLIFKSFGFKQWDVGKHYFNVGGLFTWQDGIYWGRVEQVEPPDGTDPSDLASVAFTGGLDVQVEPVGTRKLDGFFTLNVSGAWGFPIANRLNGELRLEITNLTDEQDQVNISDKGEVRRVRRDFQRPRQMRLVGAIRF